VSWASDALKSLKKVILIEEKVTTLAEDVKLLALRYQDLSQRLARIEGKLEAYERIATAAEQRKRLPKSHQPKR
jgi:hypothetical protein